MVTNAEIEFLIKARDEASGTIKGLQGSLKNMNAELKGVQIGSDQFNLLSKEIGNTKGMLEDARGAQKTFVDEFKSNWVGITATVAAATIAIKETWDLAETGAKNEQALERFKTAVNAMGGDASLIFQDLREKSGHMVDDQAIIASSNRAMALGIPVNELSGLMLLARDRARAMGLTVQEAFDLITDGVGKAQPRLLKSVGILLDAKQATKEFADANDEAASEVDVHGKQLALLQEIHQKYIATLDQAALAELSNYEKMQKTEAEIHNIHDSIADLGERALGMAYATGNSIAIMFEVIFEGILRIGQAGDQVLSKLGLTSGHSLDALIESGHHLRDTLSKEIADAMDVVTHHSVDLAGTGKQITGNFKEADAAIKGLGADLKEAEEKLNAMTQTDSLTQMRAKITALNSVMALLPITSEAGRAKYQELQAELEAVTAEMENMQRAIKGLAPLTFDLKFKMNLDASTSEMVETARQMSATISKAFSLGGSIKSPLSGIFALTPQEEAEINDQVNIASQLCDKEYGLFTDEKQKELDLIAEWERNAVQMAHDNDELINRAHAVAAEERKRVDTKTFQEAFSQAAGYAKQAFNLIGQYGAQQKQGEINNLQKEKQASDDKFDAEMANIDQSTVQGAAQYKSLQDQKTAADKKYDTQIAAAKTEQFQAEKEAQEVQAIINTAEEVTKVLATPWMIPIVAALGAAEIAVIASQPTPSFHEGGTVRTATADYADAADQSLINSLRGIYFDAPTSKEFNILVRGGETVRTEAQEKEIQSAIRERNEVERFHDGGSVRTADYADKSMMSVMKDKEIQRIMRESNEVQRFHDGAVARQAMASFDEGGTAMVHAGEVIRTPLQEKELKTGTQTDLSPLIDLANKQLDELKMIDKDIPLSVREIDSSLKQVLADADKQFSETIFMSNQLSDIFHELERVKENENPGFLGLGSLFHFQGGGQAPGTPGLPRLIIAHSGETIRTPEQEAMLGFSPLSLASSPDNSKIEDLLKRIAESNEAMEKTNQPSVQLQQVIQVMQKLTPDDIRKLTIEGMRQLGVTDPGKFFANQRSQINLG